MQNSYKPSAVHQQISKQKGCSPLLVLVAALLLTSCAPKSMYQENAKARYEEYKSSVKYHAETEEKYIILLENLERLPKEQELLIRKQILRKEIEQNRLLMLQARSEFEKALLEWDLAVQKMETGLPRDSMDLRQIFGLPRPRVIDSLQFEQ
ncbi:MAG: hypothetical protein LBU89_08160 [Fibromonadaceae bacterium]|jgi:hypothetical protein|nr:hypothetical protein [Fibromonadaceae bacterium]